jgi:hypothetical protein
MKAYTDQIAIGVPLSQAYTQEHVAPPYGFSVAESARTFASPGDKPYSGVFWRWCSTESEQGRQLVKALEDYYSWAKKHSVTLQYAADRMDVHLAAAREYFGP